MYDEDVDFDVARLLDSFDEGGEDDFEVLNSASAMRIRMQCEGLLHKFHRKVK